METSKEKISSYGAIKEYFERDGSRVEVSEMTKLTSEERLELAEMCAEALGKEIG